MRQVGPDRWAYFREVSPDAWMTLCEREGWDPALAFDLLAAFQAELQRARDAGEDSDE